MNVADIIIPIGPRHLSNHVAPSSAKQQTFPCHVIPVVDSNGRGPAWARNEGLRMATAPFVVFLDADDTIAPDFVERCLGRYEDGKYVFTSWTVDTDDKVHRPEPDFDIFERSMTHTITTLLPRRALEYVGGFDETLPGMEDIDLFIALHSIGVCGVYLDEPLFHYNRTQGNSPVSPDKSPAEVERWMADFYDIIREKHKKHWGYNMCKCKDNVPSGVMPDGPQSDEDVLAMALFTPARFRGPATDTQYAKPRAGIPFYIHRADAEMLSGASYQGRNRIRILPDPRDIAPDTDTVLDLLNKYGDSA